MRDFTKDLRFAVRMLVKSRLFSLVAIVSLALGIGVNTAFFSLLNAVLWTAPALQEPERLVEVYTSDSSGFLHGTSSYPDYRTLREESEVFASLASQRMEMASINLQDETRFIFGEIVSGNFFTTLGIPALHGRMLSDADDQTVGAHPVVVIGHGFWRKVLGADPAAVGETLEINGYPFEIVGIAPPDFKGSIKIFETEFWVPKSMQWQMGDGEDLENRGSRSLTLKGRLKPGVTPAEAQANLSVIAQRLSAEHALNRNRKFTVVPVQDITLHPAADDALTPVAALLMGLFGIVLLVACTNLASLLLARSSNRAREIAVRLAMGAGRLRIVRQLLCESLLLAMLGGLLGVGLAFFLSRLMLRFQPPLGLPLSIDLSPDLRVLIFALVLSLLTGILFGLAPALRTSRPDLIPALKGQVLHQGVSRRFLSFGSLLVMAQVTLSLVLLVASGLFVRSLAAAASTSPGFEMENALLFTVDAGHSGFKGADGTRRLASQLKSEIGALPGVSSVGTASRIPLGLDFGNRGIFIEGDERPQPGSASRQVDTVTVDGDYFAAMDIPMLRGRAFEPSDTESSPLVVVVSEALARRYWPGENPLGKSIRYRGFEGPGAEIVGIARDTKVRTLGEAPRPHLYLPFQQNPPAFHSYVVRTEGDPETLRQTVRNKAKESVPRLAILEVKTMQEHLSLGLFPIRMAGYLLAAMGGLALVLAVTGIYGVLSYSVASRTREMGIRMALGADRRRVVGEVSWQGMRMVIPGVLLGLAGAAALSSLLSSLLVGIEAHDPVTFVAVPLILAAVAWAAALVPARRASRIHPLDALRYE